MDTIAALQAWPPQSVDGKVSHTKFHQLFKEDGMSYTNKVTWGCSSEKYVAGFQWDVGKHLPHRASISYKAISESVCWKYLHYFEHWLKHFVQAPVPECYILCRTHSGTWQKINHPALKSAAVAVLITETLHTAYKNIYNVYSTWMPALLNINTICVHIISMLIRSITTDIVSCHSIAILIKQMEPCRDDSDI